MLAPVEAEPAHVVLDRVDVLLLLLRRVRVVEAEVAAAAELLRDAEVEADRLRVADVEVAVRLRREAGHDRRRGAPRARSARDDLADEVAALEGSSRHGAIVSASPRAPETTGSALRGTPSRSTSSASDALEPARVMRVAHPRLIGYAQNDVVRLLVVEDEPKMADLLARALREETHVVDVAERAEDALWMVQSTSYDAVLLDVTLPGMDGLEACRRMRAAGVWTPVLILTARDAVADRVAGLDTGADDYLAKPFSFSELFARLRALTRRVPAGAPSHARRR